MKAQKERPQRNAVCVCVCVCGAKHVWAKWTENPDSGLVNQHSAGDNTNVPLGADLV